MENASKALIIAGAILLSILIIALGVYIFNMAKSSVNTDSLSSLELSTFNSQFTQYEGEQLGSSVKSLLTAIIASNNTNEDAQDKLIEVHYDKGEGAVGDFDVVPTVQSSNDETSCSKSGGYSASDITVAGAASVMSSLSSYLANTHYYYITFEYDSEGSGYISSCTIEYDVE